MKTITLQISQNKDYIVLLALLQKFTGIKVLEKKQASKRDMAKYYGCLSQKQSIEEIDNQLLKLRKKELTSAVKKGYIKVATLYDFIYSLWY